MADAIARRTTSFEYGAFSVETRTFLLLAAIGKGLKIQSHILILIASAPVKLSSTVDRTFTLEQIAQAHRYMESNQQTGKIIITVQ